MAADHPTKFGRRSLKATWGQALGAFFVPVVIVFALRWLLIEPYVIPSGSMIPTLLIHDHISVNKLSYGLRWPFSKSWILRWSVPKPNDVVVFHYPRDPEVFFVKRVIGGPGDKVEIRGEKIFVNAVEVPAEETSFGEAEDGYVYFKQNSHLIRHRLGLDSSSDDEAQVFEVGPHELFVMGDNRDESSDSRVWGMVPVDFVIGRASMIWLSCEDTLPSTPYICDPKSLRPSRILTFVR